MVVNDHERICDANDDTFVSHPERNLEKRIGMDVLRNLNSISSLGSDPVISLFNKLRCTSIPYVSRGVIATTRTHNV